MNSTRCRVLVIERNRNVRSFLKRELLRDGHEVETTKGEDIIMDNKKDMGFDIVIVDPDLLHDHIWRVFEVFKKQSPHMNLIFHTFDMPPENIPDGWHERITVVEKGNIPALREAILGLAECCCGNKAGKRS